MSPDMIQWLFGAVAAGLLGVLGFCWRSHAHLQAEMDKIRASAGGSVTAAREELFAYKLHAAEHFASLTTTMHLEKRMVNSLEEIKETLRRQDEKLDQLMRDGRQQ